MFTVSLLTAETILRWIASRIVEILGDDDVVIELCFNLIEGSRYVYSLTITMPVLMHFIR